MRKPETGIVDAKSALWKLNAESLPILRDIVPGRIGIKRAKVDIFRPSGQPTFAFALGDVT